MTLVGAKTYRAFRKIHKWAGLAAAAWLLVLGVTGIMLDHHDWRWINQGSVPTSWTSKRIGYLIPSTVMRHMAVAGDRIVGGSERGTWYSDDGDRWAELDFEGITGQPQVTGIADLGGTGFSGTYLASDDGVWELAQDGTSATRAGLAGQHLTAISEGHQRGELVLVADKSRVVRFDLASGAVQDLAVQPKVAGLAQTVPFHRFVMDLHFGRALLPGNWSIWLNDLGGIALIVLSLTGVLYWFVTRRGRRKFMSMHSQRKSMQWLFRLHAPIIGLLGLVPILYLSLTAIPMNHIFGFLQWSEGKTLARSALPPGYQLASFDHEIDGIAAWPGQPGHLSIATRHGLLESRDNGRTWKVDLAIPIEDGAPGANVFRSGSNVFAGFGDGQNYVRESGAGEWRKLEGTTSAITTAAQGDNAVYVKNSKAIYRAPDFASPMVDTGMAFANAAPGAPLLIYIIDWHLGLVIHSEFAWANDLFAGLAFILALSGPVMWLRRKWI